MSEAGTEQEDQKTAIIERNVPFTFFSEKAEAQPDRLVESRQVKNIGNITGTASEVEMPKVRASKKWVISFEIKARAAKQKGGTRGMTALESEAGERLVMFATLQNGEVYGSFREIIDEESYRLISFNGWYRVSEAEDKTKVITLSNQRKGNPLTVDGADVKSIEFILK